MTKGELARALCNVTSLLWSIWHDEAIGEDANKLGRLYGGEVAAAHKKYLQHPTHLLGCYVEDYSSRACQHGERGCVVDHGQRPRTETARPEVGDKVRIRNGGGVAEVLGGPIWLVQSNQGGPSQYEHELDLTVERRATREKRVALDSGGVDK